MHGNEGLVGGDHVFARLNGFDHQLFGDAHATNQFNHHVDLRVLHDIQSRGHHLGVLTHNGEGSGHVNIGHHGDLNGAPRAANNFSLVSQENLKGAPSNGPYAQQSYFDRFHVECFFR